MITLELFRKEMFHVQKNNKVMLNFTSQIIYGALGTLKHLRSIGFKTFNNYWNENYDNVWRRKIICNNGFDCRSLSI